MRADAQDLSASISQPAKSMKTRSSNRKEKKARTTTKSGPAGEEEGWAALLPELFDRIVDERYLFLHEL